MKRTKEEVLASLQKFVQEANGQYTKREYQRLGYTPSHPTILKFFGSWEEALKAVGCSLVSVEVYTDHEIITAVRSSIEENEGKPSRSKYIERNGKPSITTVETRFGSWSKAVEAAGYKANEYVKYKCSDDEIIEALRRFYIQNGYEIGHDMFEKAGISPSASIIRKRFRTWNLALEAAGIPLNQRKEPRFIDMHMINAMKRVAKQIPCPLSKKMYQFYAEERDPSAISIIRRYGSWTKALIEAELPPVKNGYSDEEILALIRSFVEHVGEYDASFELYRKSGWLPGGTTIVRRFGTWENALKEMGFQPKFMNYSNEYAIEQIRLAAKENGGTLTVQEYIDHGSKPSMSWIRSHFGSWSKAKQKAGIK